MKELVFFLVTLCLCFCGTNTSKPTKKNLAKNDVLPKLSSAIIAIQIVDPNENKTSTKNFKRTIDQTLGYGYKNAAPKYEVYKYSQHDIPPFKPPPNYNPFASTHVDIQKSVEYKLPVQPGTTLFSTINQNGQVSKLSSSLPQSSGASNDVPVPIIILRVLPNQLTNPHQPLHPNLPQSHPFANSINQIDVQNLLLKYMNSLAQKNTYLPPQNQYLPPQQSQYHQQEQQPVVQQYQYQQEQYYQPQYQYYVPQQQYDDNQQYQYQQYQYQHSDKEARPYSSSGLLTHENYPSEKHTKVVFKTKSGDVKEASTVQENQPEVETKTIQIQVPENVANVQVQESYVYPNDNQQGQYQQEQYQQAPYQQDNQQEVQYQHENQQVAYQQENQQIQYQPEHQQVAYQQDVTYQPQQYQQEYHNQQQDYQVQPSANYYYFRQTIPAQQDGVYQQESGKVSTVTDVPVAKSNTRNYHTRRRVKNKKRSSVKTRPVKKENLQ